MNNKRAKWYRTLAKIYMWEFVDERVLSEEQQEKLDHKQWVNRHKLLPYATKIRLKGTQYNAIGSQKWWIKKAKQGFSYEECMEAFK